MPSLTETGQLLGSPPPAPARVQNAG